MDKFIANLSVDRHLLKKLLANKENLPIEMSSLKSNIDNDRNASGGVFVFSAKDEASREKRDGGVNILSSSLGLENDMSMETSGVNVYGKRKAEWDDGGIAKKKCTHWDTHVKRKLFQTKSNDKKKNNRVLKKSEEAKVQGKKHVGGRNLLPTNGNTDDKTKRTDFPSTSGSTHGKVKVIASNKNIGPTKTDKKINWRVSTIPLFFKDNLENKIKSSADISILQKDNCNNNDLLYPTNNPKTFISTDVIKSNFDVQ